MAALKRKVEIVKCATQAEAEEVARRHLAEGRKATVSDSGLSKHWFVTIALV